MGQDNEDASHLPLDHGNSEIAKVWCLNQQKRLHFLIVLTENSPRITPCISKVERPHIDTLKDLKVG